MENVLNNIITDIDLADAYLGADTACADAVGAEDLSAKLKQLHKEKNVRLSAEISEQLKERKARLKRDAEELDAQLASSLKAIEEKYSALSVEERADKQRQKEYKDEVSGVKTVHLRSMRKLNNDYDQDVVTIKSQQALLCQAKNKRIAQAKRLSIPKRRSKIKICGRV